MVDELTRRGSARGVSNENADRRARALQAGADGSPLDVKVFVHSSSGRAREALLAFERGVAAGGDGVSLIMDDGPYRPCDVAIVFGMPKPDRPTSGKRRPDTARRVRRDVHAAHPGPLIVIESGLIGRVVAMRRRPLGEIARLWLQGRFDQTYERINRDDHFRVAIGGASHDDGDFCNAGSPPDRWQRIAARGASLAPWRTQGEHVLVVGQVPGDTSLRGIDIHQWVEATVRAVMSHSGRPIVVRPHPMTSDADLAPYRRLARLGRNVRVELPPVGSIAESLRDAWVTVCHASGAATDSLLAGVPAITTSPGNMAWPVTGHDLSQIEAPPMPPRGQWLYDLCYGQWTADEIASGRVWARLRSRIVERADPTVTQPSTPEPARRGRGWPT